MKPLCKLFLREAVVKLMKKVSNKVERKINFLNNLLAIGKQVWQVW